MNKKTLSLAAISGVVAVSLGAFGAHALEQTLIKNEKLHAFDTANKYHFYHTLTLLFMSFLTENKYFIWAKNSFTVGIGLFSGSLYLLSVTNLWWFGPITPAGGVLLIAGWGLLALGAYQKS
ncbi:MAG: DUF423 domain-containing protein [Cyclobacteriaceae bacterium]|nr:DUF423 domain-containing protein [Cyclobacteriaceae bacterium HetDA_MAG_MS6]